MPNYNPDTGIAYGVISGNSLDPDVLNDLMYGSGATNVSWQEAEEQAKGEAENAYTQLLGIATSEIRGEAAGQGWSEDQFADAVERRLEEKAEGDREDFIDSMTERLMEDYQCDEERFEGTLDGVKYRISWLGGAIIVFVFESPHTTAARPCSPCVPGAGNLDSLEPLGSGMACYDVPNDWRAKE